METNTMSQEVKQEQPKKRKHALLGFDRSEARRITDALNEVLANYSMHYQKLRNFHWNVVGADFFDVHEKFEDQYNEAKENIDEVAERIRIYGETPFSNMSDYLKHSTIKESPTDMKAMEMVKEILKDYRILLEYLTEAVEVALDTGDSGTEDMCKGFIKDIEVHHWMMSSFSADA